jgi:hypothetical protein
MKYLILAAGLICTTVSADGNSLICTPNPVICTRFNIDSGDRFDPFVQHLLVRQQLNALPLGAQITNFYMPYPLDKRGIEEIQIRYIDELRRRKAAEAAESAAPIEPATPDP